MTPGMAGPFVSQVNILSSPSLWLANTQSVRQTLFSDWLRDMTRKFIFGLLVILKVRLHIDTCQLEKNTNKIKERTKNWCETLSGNCREEVQPRPGVQSGQWESQQQESLRVPGLQQVRPAGAGGSQHDRHWYRYHGCSQNKWQGSNITATIIATIHSPWQYGNLPQEK